MNFKKVLVVLVLSITCSMAWAGENVPASTVGFVYQLDNSNSTAFDFQIPSRTSSCGSSIYRSYSPSDAIASRKFSMVLAAFMSGKKIEFYDNQSCDGSRSKVGWIRLVN